MQQKVFKAGNSYAVTIPQTIRQGLEIGDIVDVQRDSKGIHIVPIKEKKEGQVTAKFMQMVEDFIDRHEDVLEELANR